MENVIGPLASYACDFKPVLHLNITLVNIAFHSKNKTTSGEM